jgi:long-chain fatty acid transport protein
MGKQPHFRAATDSERDTGRQLMSDVGTLAGQYQVRMDHRHNVIMKTHRFRSSLGMEPASLAAATLVVATSLSALGEGFRNPPPDSFSLGRAGGRIAQIDNAAAVQQNPANLVGLTNVQFEFTPSIIYIHVKHTSMGGSDAETTDPWKVLPNAYGVVPLMGGKLVAGLGVTVPYGLSNEWKKDGAFADPLGLRYQAPWYTELKTINANPAIAFNLTDSLSVGAGLDVMWSELTLKQFYPWAPWGSSTEGNLKAQGDGIGFGGNVGITWRIAERHRLALTYRSPVSVDYSGDFTVDNIPPFAAGAGVTARSDFSSHINFPTIIAAGYGIDLSDRVRLEVDGEWLQFSNFKSLDLGVENNAVLFPSTSIPQNWKDTFTVGVGGDWRFSPEWILRFGYQFYESPVPDSTFSPTIPDANQNVITVGLGYHHGPHSFEVAYGLDFYDERTITADQNPAFNGNYNMTVHLFSMAYRLNF